MKTHRFQKKNLRPLAKAKEQEAKRRIEPQVPSAHVPPPLIVNTVKKIDVKILPVKNKPVNLRTKHFGPDWI